jgi:hypothetical protein
MIQVPTNQLHKQQSKRPAINQQSNNSSNRPNNQNPTTDDEEANQTINQQATIKNQQH